MNNNDSYGKLADSLKAMNTAIGKMVSEVQIPRFEFPNASALLNSPNLTHIQSVRNPLIGLNEELLVEIKRLNTSIDAMNSKILQLETNAIKTEKQNVRRQWIIAIVSALIGGFVGSVLTLI